ncbi:MAG: thioredoxin family protein [Planctomycetota bacterium]|jgi:peroxiredoxin
MRGTIFAIITVLALSALMLSSSEGKEYMGAAEEEKKAAGFTLTNYDGNEVSLSGYEGKIIVLEWFNYECPFVRYHYKDTNTMIALAGKYKEKDVVWLAINSTKHLKVEKNENYAKKYNISYPILDDRSGEVGKAYSAKTTPHMFIIDTEGKIVYNGAIDDSPLGKKKEDVTNYVDKALAELIADKEISTPRTKPYGCSVKYAR